MPVVIRAKDRAGRVLEAVTIRHDDRNYDDIILEPQYEGDDLGPAIIGVSVDLLDLRDVADALQRYSEDERVAQAS